MEQFELIRRLAGHFHSISAFLMEYGMYLTLAGLVFCLLNCFLGYRLRKIWNIFVGFLTGSAAALSLCMHFDISFRWALAASLAGGIICALLAYLLYRLGLFILCFGLTVSLLIQLLPAASTTVLAVFLIIGAVVGGLAIAKERVTVSLVTAIGGGFGSSLLLLSLMGQGRSLLLILLTALLSFLGILVQLKPWKDRGYWKQEDANLKQERREKARRRSQQRKSRRKQKKKEKRAKKKAKRKDRAQTKNDRSAKSRRRPANKSASSSAYAPQPAPQQTAEKASPVHSEAYNPQPKTSPELSRGESLDDIQLHLSREISEIFAEQQTNPQDSQNTDTPEKQAAPKEP